MIAGLIIAAVIAVDQIVKILVRANMTLGEKRPLIPGFVEMYHTENGGASFGILKDARWVFMILSTIALVIMLYVLIRYYKTHVLLNVSLAFLIGGGIGNMIDRLFVTNAAGEKVVTDMFNFTFVDFAIFNVADIFITTGTILLAVFVLFYYSKTWEKLKKPGSMAESAVVKADAEQNSNEDNGNA